MQILQNKLFVVLPTLIDFNLTLKLGISNNLSHLISTLRPFYYIKKKYRLNQKSGDRRASLISNYTMFNSIHNVVCVKNNTTE